VPAELLSNRPVVMDAAYKPAETALLAQARDAGCPFVQVRAMIEARLAPVLAPLQTVDKLCCPRTAGGTLDL
jgi:hypothetical protein